MGAMAVIVVRVVCPVGGLVVGIGAQTVSDRRGFAGIISPIGIRIRKVQCVEPRDVLPAS